MNVALLFCSMSFGSSGIYVGGKDTFISELSGNWNVKGEVFPQVCCTSAVVHKPEHHHAGQRKWGWWVLITGRKAAIVYCRASWATQDPCPA
jgi:hypothetical protein